MKIFKKIDRENRKSEKYRYDKREEEQRTGAFDREEEKMKRKK